MPQEATNTELIAYLKDRGVLRSPAIAEALAAVDRKDFVLPEYLPEAYEDRPLPIGFGQTISQPTTVVFMLELLDVFPGATVLDVGSGSGWTTALLAHLVGPQGKVIGLERIPDLVTLGQQHLQQYPYSWAHIQQATPGVFGIPGEQFDRILVSAAAEEIPQSLIDQLKPGGILVMPVQDGVVRVFKRKDGSLEKEYFPGFRFVPLLP